jgi:hypothetical protein
MGLTFQLCSAGRPRLLTRYFGGQSQAIFRSSNQLNSNLNTAKALSLIIPDKILAVADEVIE